MYPILSNANFSQRGWVKLMPVTRMSHEARFTQPCQHKYMNTQIIMPLSLASTLGSCVHASIKIVFLPPMRLMRIYGINATDHHIYRFRKAKSQIKSKCLPSMLRQGNNEDDQHDFQSTPKKGTIFRRRP